MRANYLSDDISAFSPLKEMCAYEALWEQENASFKTIHQKLSSAEKLPSDFIDDALYASYMTKIFDVINLFDKTNFGIVIKGTEDYPKKLLDAQYPVRVLYYQGYWDLVYSKCVAVIGTRTPTDAGIKRTKKLVRQLVEDGYTIVSGLAQGIDTIAHETAIECGGQTIAVIGTSLAETYPKKNKWLQEHLSKHFLVISQVPFFYYQNHDYRMNRFFFPERNITMSALSLGSIIVEAGETSGTLTQAKAALKQGRSLFILDNNFQIPSLTWPLKLEEKGAIRVKEYDDVRAHLPSE